MRNQLWYAYVDRNSWQPSIAWNMGCHFDVQAWDGFHAHLTWSSRSLLRGCTVLNMYEYTWVHRRGILTLNIYLKRNTNVFRHITSRIQWGFSKGSWTHVILKHTVECTPRGSLQGNIKEGRPSKRLPSLETHSVSASKIHEEMFLPHVVRSNFNQCSCMGTSVLCVLANHPWMLTASIQYWDQFSQPTWEK